MQTYGAVKVFAQPPHRALRPFVKRFLVVEFPSPLQDSHLPDIGLFVAFPFLGTCYLEDGRLAPRAGVTGIFDRIRHHAHSRDNAVLLAAFTPTGAAAFLRRPLDELASTTVALDDLIGDAPLVARLDEQLVEAPNHLRRMQLLEDFLLARTVTASPDPLVAAAVEWIEHAAPNVRIGKLVRHIGLSQGALERRFRRVVGTSPKRFASLVRLKSVEKLHAAGASLTTIAHAAGYFDQSHFIHDFKRTTGLSPEVYFSLSTDH